MLLRRPIIDRRPLQNMTVGVALAISLVMLTPPLSPVIGGDQMLPFFEAPKAIPAKDVRFGSLPVNPDATRRAPVEAKGILMTGYTAGGTQRFNELLTLIKNTELNAVVIDIKDERGEVSWIPRSPMARAAGAGLQKIKEPKARIRQLKRAGVYVIGRVVSFQDSIMAKARPDLALLDRQTGGVWVDDRDPEKPKSWLDPYSPGAQDYNIALAVEAIELGFDEIQFDYVRFPSDGDVDKLWSRYKDHRPASEVIRSFLERARHQIVTRGAYISADAFGLITLVQDDLGIGQKIELIAREVDYLSLMLYPSHFNKPEYGIADPEKVPKETVAVSLADAKRRIKGTKAKLRPWLQDFTLAGGVPYTPKEVRDQIEAAEEAGVDEWLLWNARNYYTEDALRSSAAHPPVRDSRASR